MHLTACGFTLLHLKRLPDLILGHIRVQLCGARIFMPHHPLHTIEALAVLRQLSNGLPSASCSVALIIQEGV